MRGQVFILYIDMFIVKDEDPIIVANRSSLMIRSFEFDNSIRGDELCLLCFRP